MPGPRPKSNECWQVLITSRSFFSVFLSGRILLILVWFRVYLFSQLVEQIEKKTPARKGTWRIENQWAGPSNIHIETAKVSFFLADVVFSSNRQLRSDAICLYRERGGFGQPVDRLIWNSHQLRWRSRALNGQVQHRGSHLAGSRTQHLTWPSPPSDSATAASNERAPHVAGS